MLNIISWLIGSKTGRIIALVGLSLASAFFIAFSLFRKGKEAERIKQTAAALKSIQERIQSDDEISKKSHADRLHDLSFWVRDNEGK